ncbi:MAG TPA: hypothetical protein VFL76_06630 [Edaphocola sp.]|nr:hypothetical protein [Edaphocola sp.]
MNKQEFSPDDSLKTIDQALRQAKAEKTGASFYYLLWGAILFIYFFLLFVKAWHPEVIGGLLTTLMYGVFPIGGLLSYLRSKGDDRREKARGYFENVYLFGFAGFAIAYGIIFLTSVYRDPVLPAISFPLLLGFTVFVVGGITKHKASIICGILGMICTGVSLNVSLEMQYLIAALAAVIVCIVPGLLMKYKNV